MRNRIVPPVTADIYKWAENIRRYLGRALDQLAAKDSTSVASEDGIILYDRENGYPVVSKDGEWRQIILADGYAQMIQDADITAASADTAYAITYDTPALGNGITLGTPASRIVFEEGGLYLVTFTAQIRQNAFGNVEIRFWPRINGVDVAGSTMVNRMHNVGATITVSRSAIFTVSANDYLEAMWSTDNTNAFLEATAATAWSPAAPATTITLTRIRA